MALLKSGNPTMSDKIFGKSVEEYNGADGVMTVNGAIAKFGFLLLMVMAGAFYTWNLLAKGNIQLMQILLWVGIFGGLVCALIITFVPKTAKYLSPLYAILEGLALGGISAFFNAMFAQSYPGIVIQAVGITFAVAAAMLALYSLRIIKVTDKLRSVIISATVGVALFYLIAIVLGFFHINGAENIAFYGSGWLSIGISVVIVLIAAFNLLLDFDLIERGSQMGAPKYMEWYGAFGLLVTLVWLYLRILRLLAQIAGRK